MESQSPRRVCGQDGFSLTELLIVTGLIGIVGGLVIVNTRVSAANARADAVSSQVVNVLRYGRDASFSQRRTVDLVFIAPNRMRLIRNDRPVGTTVLTDVVLEQHGRFQVDGALPDTPDGFGRSAAVDFDEAATLRFQPDGTLTDGTGVPINGTVFTSIPGEPLSQRATTVTGTTARPQAWRWSGSRWEAQ